MTFEQLNLIEPILKALKAEANTGKGNPGCTGEKRPFGPCPNRHWKNSCLCTSNTADAL